MKLNGSELESKYVEKIVRLKKIKQGRFNSLFIHKARKQLKKRLQRLESDYDKGLVSDRAYTIWKNMIKEVL